MRQPAAMLSGSNSRRLLKPHKALVRGGGGGHQDMVHHKGGTPILIDYLSGTNLALI